MPKKSNLSLVVIAIVIIGAAIIGALVMSSDADRSVVQAPTETEIGGEVVYVEGSVEYRRDGGDWKRVSEGESLSEGDSVETFGGARAIINLDDGSVLRLNENSSLTLVSMDPAHIVISNDGGEVYSRVVKADRVFEVVAGDVVYESLGTAYKTKNTEKEESVEVYHSKVKVTEGGEETIVDEGKKLYLKNTDNPDEEKTVLDLGEDIDEDAFVKWNQDEDTKSGDAVFKLGEEDKEEVSSISLSYKGGGEVGWTSDVPSTKGYKLVWSKTENPTYPSRSGDKYVYYDDSNASSGQIKNFDNGGTYYIRVCEYLGGECGVYSNQVTATFLEDEDKNEPVPEKEVNNSGSGVNSISASVSGSKVSWSVNGYSKSGFKVVWSKNSNPTYPTRSGDKYKYLTDSNASYAALTDFDGPGTYYVRVCEYLGGKCGVYSNQVTMTFEGEVVSDDVDSISLSGSGSNVSWSTNGHSEKGFKVVWSKNSNPTYPTRSGDKYKYLSDSSASSASLTAFDGDGTYYVRVCEYLGGSCGVYSNQITIELN